MVTHHPETVASAEQDKWSSEPENDDVQNAPSDTAQSDTDEPVLDEDDTVAEGRRQWPRCYDINLPMFLRF